MTLPNLIVAGAQKSGTTTLWDLLDQHPDCFMSRPKEPSHFSRSSYLTQLAGYEQIFAPGEGRRIIGEASTSYMTDVPAIGRMREVLDPQTKFVFIIRNPAKRAYSAYLHAAQRPSEYRRPDEVFAGLPHDDPAAAIAAEAERLETAYRERRATNRPYAKRYEDGSWPHRYILNGFYSIHIDKYRKAFGEDRVHVMLFEELTRNPIPALNAMAAFLDIDPKGFPTEIPHKNATEERFSAADFQHWRRVLKQLLLGKRSLRSGKLDPAAFPPSPSPAILSALSAVFRRETELWSNYFSVDLRELGW